MSLILRDMIVKTMLQGRISVNSNGGCVYRSQCGNFKCAVGQVIPDDLYTPELEEFTVEKLIQLGYINKKYGTVDTYTNKCMVDIQLSHDVLHHGNALVGFVHDFACRIATRTNAGHLPSSCLDYIEEGYKAIQERS